MSYRSVIAVCVALLAPACFALAQPPAPAGGFDAARRVYVPLEDLDAVLQRDARGVMLPREEFDALDRAARENAAGRPRTPRAIILSQADYAARVEGEQLLLSVTAKFTNFTEGWTQLVLGAAGVGVESAAMDGEPARLARCGSPATALTLYISEPGAHTLTVELSAPLASVGGDKAAGFEIFAAPSGELRMQLPAGKFLSVGGLELERPAPVDRAAEYVVPIGGLKSLQLRITDRQAAATGDAMVFANTGFGVHVAPGEVTWTARTMLQVFGRTIDRLICTVPAELEITDVESSGLDAWELADAPDAPGRTRITLSYRQPFDGSREITFRGVVAAPSDAAWTVPDLVIQSATSHVGRLVVQYPPGVRVQATESSGVRPVLPEQAMDASAPSLEYEVWQEDFLLSFTTKTKDREVHAAMTSLLDIHAAGLDLYITLDVRTLFSPLFDLRLRLPAEWSVTAASVAGEPVAWQVAPQEAGINEVRLPFAAPLAINESRPATLVAHLDPEKWPIENEPVRLKLPEVRLPQVGVVEALYGITSDDDLDVTPIDVSGLDPARAADVQLLNSKLQTAGRAVRLGFTYQDSTFTGQLDAARKPSRIAASTVTFFRIDRETLFGHLEAQLAIDGGGVRELQVQVSESTGEDLRFQIIRPASAAPQAANAAPGLSEPVRIVEQKPSAAADGLRTWTLQFDRRVRGDVVLLVDVQTPRTAGETFAPFVLNILNSDRQSGHIALEAANEQQINVVATDVDGAPLRTVDPVDFPPAYYRPAQRVVAGYQYVRPGWQMSIAETRYDRHAVPTAIVHAARLTSIIGKNGEAQHATDLALTAVGIQNLKVKLPENAELWGALLDEAPIEVRKSDDGDLIALTPAADPLQVRRLRLMYRSRVRPLDESAVRLRQVPPRVSAINGAGVEQPLEILEQEWTVHYPDDAMLVASDGRFHPVGELDRDSLLGRISQTFRAPAPRDMLWGGIVMIAAAGIIWLLTLGYFRFQSLGVLLGILIVGAVLFALLLPATQQAREAARRTGDMAAYDFDGDGVTAAPSSTPDSAAEFGDFADKDTNVGDRFGAFPAPAGAPQQGAEPQSGERLSRAAAPAEREIPPFESLSVSGQAPGGTQGRSQGEPSDRPIDRSEDAAGVYLHGIAGRGIAGRGALLSLMIDLQPPPEFVRRDFFYHGNTTDDGTADLDVLYVDRRAGRLVTLAVATGLALLFWLYRRRSFASRARLGILAIAGPLALMTVAPVSWMPTLDGLFLGALAGLGLWLLLCLVQCCVRCCGPSRNTAVKTALGLGVLAGTCGFNQYVFAHEPLARPAPAAELPPKEGVIIVPYAAGTDPLTAPLVYLPYQEFLKRWNLAHPDERKLGPAPIDGVISTALYAARLEGEGDGARVRVSARYVVHNLRDGQISLTLPLGRVAIRSSALDGASAPLQALVAAEGAFAVESPGGSYRVVLETEGAHVLDVEFDVPLRTTGVAGEFTLPLRPAPAAKLSFALPAGDDLIVRVTGGIGTYRVLTTDAGRVVEAAVDERQDVTVSWQPRTQQGDVDGVVHVESVTAVRIDDAGLHLSLGLQYRVRQGTLNEAVFSLPAGLSLQKVAGPDVAGWEAADDGESRTLRVFLRRAIENETQLTIDLYQPLSIGNADATVTIPQAAPRGVTRETGVVGLFAPAHLSLRMAAQSGATQINASSFTGPVVPGPAADVPQYAYRFTSRPFELSASVSRRRPETRAVAEHGVSVNLRKLVIASRLQFDLSGAPRPTVSVALPAGYLPIDVAASHLADWYVSAAGDTPRILTIELDQPRTGRVEVLLEGHVARQPDETSPAIALPRPLEVRRLDSTLAVWLDSSYTATLAALEGWRSIDPAGLSEQVRGLQTRPAQFAFVSSVVEPQPVSLALTRATGQLAADAVTLVAVTDTSVDYGFTWRWKISGAAAETFVVALPGWLKGRVEFSGAGIRQTSPQDVDDGRVRWTISLVDPVSAEYVLTAVATLPPPADQLVRIPSLTFEQPGDGGVFRPLDLQSHHAVLVNLSGTQLSPVDPGQIDSVSRDQLPLALPEHLLQQAMEIVRMNGEQSPAWRMERLQQADTANATVTAARMTSVFDYDGSWRLEAVYTVRNRGRQFLALQLPEQSRVLSVSVRNQPARTVETRLGADVVHLVALPQTSAADLSFDVRLVLAGRLPRALPERFQLIARQIELPAPAVISRERATKDGRPELGMPVLQTQWTVRLPDDLDASPVSDASRTNVSLDEEAWALLQRRQEADIAALSRVLADPYASDVIKSFACSNLKQLAVELQTSQSARSGYPGSFATSGPDSYWSRNSELQAQCHEAVAKFEAGKAAAPVVEGRPSFGLDVSGFELNGRSDSSQRLGRQYILGNSAAIIEENAFNEAQADRDADLGFNFRANGSVRPEDLGVLRGKEADGRSHLRRQLQVQDALGDELLEQRKQSSSPGGERTPAGGIGGGRVFLNTPFAHGSFALDGVEFERTLSLMDASGRAGDESALAGLAPAAQSPSSGWTTVGGLSLPIDLPQTGSTLTFTKVGGEPRLALSVRPRRTLTLGLGAVWTLLWVLAAAWMIRVLARRESQGHGHGHGRGPLASMVFVLLMAVGIVGFFLVPGPVRWLLFVLFVIGALLYAIQIRRSAAAATPGA